MPDGDSDKEDRGRVMLVAGSRQIPGAAVLAATAALRTGAGRVTIAAPQSIAQSIGIAVPESRVIALNETEAGGIAADMGDALDEFAHKARALLVGPGLPYDDESAELASRLLDRFSKAGVILDAAAMGVVRNETRFSVPMLLTPHAGEMASLTDARKESIQAQPADAARRAARAWNAVIALKGAVTYLAAPDGRVWRHEGGNPGLAMSGSGDVLAGIIAGLAARGLPLEGAAAWGVALHARAGERLAQRLGPLGYLARELPGEIPALMAAGSSSRA
jgi:hydroxyethylthiazole kinase-like uncharacterized protein yjeF